MGGGDEGGKAKQASREAKERRRGTQVPGWLAAPEVCVGHVVVRGVRAGVRYVSCDVEKEEERKTETSSRGSCECPRARGPLKGRQQGGEEEHNKRKRLIKPFLFASFFRGGGFCFCLASCCLSVAAGDVFSCGVCSYS